VYVTVAFGVPVNKIVAELPKQIELLLETAAVGIGVTKIVAELEVVLVHVFNKGEITFTKL
jgi:hypothetical protein